MILTFLIIVLLIGSWSALIIYLDGKKVLERYNMSRIWGIFLMWRTKRGRDLIEWLARPKRFWNGFAMMGLALLFFGMISMFLLILASTLTVVILGFTGTVSAQEVFVLPGLNPYVPLIYGLIALVFAVVIHELSHGILSRANDIKVKYLGLLFMVVPVGAFMEPDEEQVKIATRLKRIKMYAAGPIINFIFAFVFIVLFSSVMMGSVSAPDDPFIVTDVFEGSSLEYSSNGFESLFQINGTKISSAQDMYEYGSVEPGSWISVKLMNDDTPSIVPAIAGIMIFSVTEDSPAGKGGFEEGSIIYSIDGGRINSRDTLTEILEDTRAGDNTSIVLLVPVKDEGGEVVLNRSVPSWLLSDLTEGKDALFPIYEKRTFNVTLDDKYDHIPINTYKGKGFLGIGSSYLGIGGLGSGELLGRIKSPIASADSIGEAFSNLMYMTFSLPLSTTIVPFHHPLTSVYEIQGPLSFMPDGMFWFIANCLFYLFWLNVLLALFNALPAYPLDGGVIFKDTIVLIGLNFVNKDRIEKLDRLAGKIAAASSIAVFGLILITWLYPYLRLILNGF